MSRLQICDDENYRPNVGIMLVNNTGLIFSGQRIDNPAWQMPQGGVDPGESEIDAAVRELEEETGVKPDKIEILSVTKNWYYYDLPTKLAAQLWRGRYKGQKQRWFLVSFLGSDTDVNIHTKMPEFTQWKWSTETELISSIVPFKLEVYRSVFDEFRPKINCFQS